MSEAETLYRLLSELASVGAVVLRKMSDGKWHAGVKFPAPKGITADVDSDYKHSTPIEALQCVYDRLGGLRSMVNIKSPAIGVAHQEVAQ